MSKGQPKGGMLLCSILRTTHLDNSGLESFEQGVAMSCFLSTLLNCRLRIRLEALNEHNHVGHLLDRVATF